MEVPFYIFRIIMNTEIILVAEYVLFCSTKLDRNQISIVHLRVVRISAFLGPRDPRGWDRYAVTKRR